MTQPMSFRQRLDAILRSLDYKQVQEFLIAEKQWSAEVPVDPEFAMWMMVAASSTLRDLHGRARLWLVEHGHNEEAQALSARESGGSQRKGGGVQKRKGAGGGPQRQSAKPASRPRGSRPPQSR